MVLLYAVGLNFLVFQMKINYLPNYLVVFTGRDAAFIGPGENHFAILDEDKTGLSLYTLPGASPPPQGANVSNGVVDGGDQTMDSEPTDVTSVKGPMQFMFESEVDQIFSTPLGTLKRNFA